MSYNTEEIIARYHRNCEIIANNYQEHLKIYELGIISKVEEDFKENNIKDMDSYFSNITKQYELFVQQLNDDINQAIEVETNNFTKAFSSFLLLNQIEDKNFTVNSDMLRILKKIYTKKRRKNKKIGEEKTYIVDNNKNKVDALDVDAEILELIKEIEKKI